MSQDTDRANQKPPSVDRLSLLWRRTNDHKMVQWGVAYVALAYGLQHGVVLTGDAFEWPHMVTSISMLLLVLGLPLVMTLAWYHGARASRNFSQAELSILAALLAIGSLFFYVLVKPAEQVAVSRAPTVQQAGVATLPKGVISLAVLPFVNLSGDNSQEFFSDGMTEEITSALAKVPNLRVVGRTSAFQFKSANKDLRAIGQALSATHLIEGSVRKDGNQLRITAQLIKAEDGTHVWTESYDRELKGVFAVQEEIAQAIAGSLRVPLGLKQGETLVRGRTTNDAAYEDYLRAKALVRTRATADLAQAAKLLEQVVSEDPNFAPAWALLAVDYAYTPYYQPAYYGGSIALLKSVAQAMVPKAEAAARRALEIDPKNPEALIALSGVQVAQEKYDSANNLQARALGLDPDNPEAIWINGVSLADQGYIRRSLPLVQRLHALEPFVPAYINMLATVISLSGQPDQAIGLYKDIPVGSVNGQIGVNLASVYAEQGRFKEAADTLQSLPAGIYDPKILGTAVRVLRGAPKPASGPLPYLGNLSWVYFFAGAPERIYEYKEALHSIPMWSPTLRYWSPTYRSARNTERFKKLMRDVGFVNTWKAKGWPDLCHPTTGDDFECN